MVKNSIYESVIQQLTQIGVDSPRLEARILIGNAAHIDPCQVNHATTLDNVGLERLKTTLEQRLNHKPIDKIIGYKDFYKYRFKVSEKVLSPRPDTEIVVEAALDIIKAHNFKTILDLGTGSGCILLSLLKECPTTTGTGIDLSYEALEIAKDNRQMLQLTDRCEFTQADWFDENFCSVIGVKYDIIVSNPPYIPCKDIKLLEPDVKDFDPLTALNGGDDGLECYRRIAEIACRILNRQGRIVLEMGQGQSQDILSIFQEKGFELVLIMQDLSSIERCIIFRKKDCI